MQMRRANFRCKMIAFLTLTFEIFNNHSFPTWIPLFMCTTPSGSSSICRAEIAIVSIETRRFTIEARHLLNNNKKLF